MVITFQIDGCRLLFEGAANLVDAIGWASIVALVVQQQKRHVRSDRGRERVPVEAEVALLAAGWPRRKNAEGDRRLAEHCRSNAMIDECERQDAGQAHADRGNRMAGAACDFSAQRLELVL